MRLFTWLFKDEVEEERLAQADRDNKALERALGSLRERVGALESKFRELSIDKIYQTEGIHRPLPIRKKSIRRPLDPYAPVYPTTRDDGATTALIVAGMTLSGGYDSSSSSSDSSSSSNDSSSSSDSSSCGGGD